VAETFSGDKTASRCITMHIAASLFGIMNVKGRVTVELVKERDTHQVVGKHLVMLVGVWIDYYLAVVGYEYSTIIIIIFVYLCNDRTHARTRKMCVKMCVKIT